VATPERVEGVPREAGDDLERRNETALGKAIGYVLTRWTALTRYRDDGTLEIDRRPPALSSGSH
jgi:hypothetical protein